MRERQADRTQRYVVFVTGVFLLLLLVGLAVAIPEPTRAQERTFTVVLMLAAGAFALMLAGELEVEGYHPSFKVKAGGAIGFAVFIALIYRVLL